MMLIRVILFIAGIGLALNGWAEWQVSSKASAEPQFIDLAELEAGKPPPDTHIALGHHWRLWDELQYSYEVEKDGDPEAPDTKINYTLYPLISDGHPHSRAFDQMFDLYGSAQAIPEEDWPVLKDFAVLIRTKKFKRVRDLPTDGYWEEGSSLTGLVVNDSEPLKPRDKALLRQYYPQLDLDRVLIIEEGRVPMPMMGCLTWLGMGCTLMFGGVAWTIHASTGRAKGVGELPPLIKRAEVMG